MPDGAHSAGMDERSLTGLVVVVAGSTPFFAELARAITTCGALVATLAPQRDESLALAYKGDPLDAGAWSRIAPHVEQRLGPVDLVACDTSTRPVVEPVFGPDLRRRGHGGVVVLRDEDGIAAAVTTLAGTL